MIIRNLVSQKHQDGKQQQWKQQWKQQWQQR